MRKVREALLASRYARESLEGNREQAEKIKGMRGIRAVDKQLEEAEKPDI